MGVHIYIEIWTLKTKCTPYGFCGQTAFKNAKAMYSVKLVGVGKSFQLGPTNFNVFMGGYPAPYPPHPKSS